MKLLALLSLLLAPMVAHAQDRPDYAPGQVWEYRTRPGEERSLLKIQRIEPDPRGDPIYHIGVVGLKIPAAGGMARDISHLPVSRATLDASVIRLSADPGTGFRDADEGIAMWRDAKGGVFTAPMTAILDIVEGGLRQRQPAN